MEKHMLLYQKDTYNLNWILINELEAQTLFYRTMASYEHEKVVHLPLIVESSERFCLIDMSVWQLKGLPKAWLWKLMYLTAKAVGDEKKLMDHVNKRDDSIKYVLVSLVYERMIIVLESIANGIRKQPFVISIDGPAASGKTTLGNQLSDITKSSIIHMDDFFLIEELRTSERLNEAGGNVHYERFKDEVIDQLRLKKDFTYNRFDCKTMTFSEKKMIPYTPLIIVEGSYSRHPYFGEYYDLSVFCQVDESEQKQRIIKRNGLDRLKDFEERWIPMEEKYAEAFKIKECSDLLL